MTIPEKQELVRLLNLYQADLLDQNWKNCENEITKDFVPGVKAQYETLCRTRQVYQDMVREITIKEKLTNESH